MTLSQLIELFFGALVVFCVIDLLYLFGLIAVAVWQWLMVRK